jgi:methionyl-tRNA formyltransferase
VISASDEGLTVKGGRRRQGAIIRAAFYWPTWVWVEESKESPQMPTPLRTAFFGTPDFAVPILKRVATDDQFEVVLVVTQPDRPTGRGRRIEPPPVKQAAEHFGLPVAQPASLRVEMARQSLVAADADLFVVAAYGLIFGRKTLALPRLGCVNVHASLLPRYRGASPITAALLNGDEETGIALMVMESGLDTGPVIASTAMSIESADTTESLTARLAELGAGLAVDAIPRWASGELVAVPQPAQGASIVRPLTKADGWIDWSQSADLLERQVRAMWPWPRAWTTAGDRSLQVHAASVVPARPGLPPGMVVDDVGSLMVTCGDGALALQVVQPAGSRPMSGAELLAGRRVRPGDRLGISGAPPPRPPLITRV